MFFFLDFLVFCGSKELDPRITITGKKCAYLVYSFEIHLWHDKVERFFGVADQFSDEFRRRGIKRLLEACIAGQVFAMYDPACTSDMAGFVCLVKNRKIESDAALTVYPIVVGVDTTGNEFVQYPKYEERDVYKRKVGFLFFCWEYNGKLWWIPISALPSDAEKQQIADMIRAGKIDPKQCCHLTEFYENPVEFFRKTMPKECVPTPDPQTQRFYESVRQDALHAQRIDARKEAAKAIEERIRGVSRGARTPAQERAYQLRVLEQAVGRKPWRF
ncbi:MAG: hypothetical protein AAB323_01105 [Pseudomonadota bacterium]